MTMHSFAYYQIATQANTKYQGANFKYHITFDCLQYQVFLLSSINLMAMLVQYNIAADTKGTHTRLHCSYVEVIATKIVWLSPGQVDRYKTSISQMARQCMFFLVRNCVLSFIKTFKGPMSLLRNRDCLPFVSTFVIGPCCSSVQFSMWCGEGFICVRQFCVDVCGIFDNKFNPCNIILCQIMYLSSSVILRVSSYYSIFSFICSVLSPLYVGFIFCFCFCFGRYLRGSLIYGF